MGCLRDLSLFVLKDYKSPSVCYVCKLEWSGVANEVIQVYLYGGTW